jgi:hypothetical protein
MFSLSGSLFPHPRLGPTPTAWTPQRLCSPAAGNAPRASNPDLLHCAGLTHSGFATTLRVADANDKFFPEGSMLFQYEGTFMFDTVTPDLPTDLPRGQVIARGVAL